MTKKTYFFTLFALFITFLSPLRAQVGHFIPSDRFSSSLIATVCQDAQGSMWIGTDYGLNRFDGYYFQTFLHRDDDSTSLVTNTVVKLFCDSKGNMWVGTSDGLDRFNADTETFTHYPFPDGYRPRVSSIIECADGTLLLGTAGYGAYSLGPDGQLKPLDLGDSSAFFSLLYQDAEGRIWRSGFDENISYLHDGDFKTFRSQKSVPNCFVEQDGEVLVVCQHGIMSYSQGRLSVADADMSIVEGKDVIFTRAVKSPDGYIYIGTRGKGLYRLTPRPHKLEKVNVSVLGIDLNSALISTLTVDRRGNLWLGCHRKGLVVLPTRPQPFSSWSFEAQGIHVGSCISSVCEGDDGIIWTTVQGVGIYGFSADGHVVRHPQAPDAVEFIFRDKQKRYWVGTDNGLFSYDPLTGQSQQRVTFECDKFNDMTSDDRGNIYISTFSRGFCVYNPQTGQLRNYDMNAPDDPVRGRLCNNWIMAMMPDRDGRLWMATSSGVSCYDPKADTFRPYGWSVLLDDTMCFSLCQTSQGHILIGTSNGLYEYVPGQQQAAPISQGDVLRDKVVNYVVEDNQGNIWCATSDGIWQYERDSHTFIAHMVGNGLTKKEYIFNVGLHTNDNHIYFGHNDGLTTFVPTAISNTYTEPEQLQLTAFRVGDQYVNASTELNGVNITGGKAVGQCSYFTLSYLDHTVTLAFSQFNIDNAQNITLQYRVNDDKWIRLPEGKNEFTLGHLQPGSYRIEVQATQGVHAGPSKVVVVTVRSPWYSTPVAFFIYFLILAALAAFVFFNYRRRARQQLDEEKMKFLINATHDIRSPLTIILAALKKLEKNPAVETIEHNSKRILNLVNQILDVRKIDKQQMHLHCQPTDMVSFVQGIGKMFEFNAKERGISFRFDHEGTNKLEAWVDRTQFDKVVTNLLSNAFKYCRDNGEVTIRLAAKNDSWQLQVQDNGMGIDDNTQKHIFDRFYQGGNSRKMNIDGTGIGLNLCKMIVDMHHGTIVAANRNDGQQGALFTVTMPMGNAHLKPEEMETTAPKPQTANNAVQTVSSKKHVLIVDDDAEIAQYVEQELSRYYKFGICANGKEAMHELLMNDYDLVVSDVMMPEMDGFTLLRMIKTNMNIAHLPVVMLTSKADVANRLEGLERGADAFLAKPFDMEELHLTIDNLLQTRQRLKGKYSGAQRQADKLEQPEVKGNDELLMERIMKAVNKNLGDSDFNVEQLCQEVGISRAQLHRKMKEITGLTTSEFIRNIRLEQAARLLKEQKVNVTQVAYTVGFSNLAHFSTIFRKHFGVTPSEYAEKSK